MKSSDFAVFDPFFGPKENWGDLEKLNWMIPWMCYQIRINMKSPEIDWPMVINCAYETKGHSENSYHYKGLAVDFHFNSPYVPLVNQYSCLEKTLIDLKIDKFVGFGVYPDWEFPGFHLDLRGSSMNWIRVKGKYTYWNTAQIRKMLFEHK